MKNILIVLMLLFSISVMANETTTTNTKKKLAYIVSDIRIPFWEIMSRGIKSQASELGYEIKVYSANNLLKNELVSTAKAIKSGVDGIIISPISSSSAVTILKLATKAKVPVVISDIGADKGKYVSFISSDNRDGAYKIGQVLVKKMKEMKWQDGTVGIVSIPQKRANGKARTAGFMRAMEEAGIKSSGLYQQVTFSYQETYDHSMKLIKNDTKIRAIWLQGSDRYKGALDAIKDSGKKEEILLICFDAEPEFLTMIPQGILVGAAMQQPFLMGEKAVFVLDQHINGHKVENQIQLPILAVSTENIEKNLPTIKRNVLGINGN